MQPITDPSCKIDHFKKNYMYIFSFDVAYHIYLLFIQCKTLYPGMLLILTCFDYGQKILEKSSQTLSTFWWGLKLKKNPIFFSKVKDEGCGIS